MAVGKARTFEQHIKAGAPAGTYPLNNEDGTPGEEVPSKALTEFRRTGVVPADIPRTRRKVRATKTGYYEHTVRQVGDVFTQDDAVSSFSDRWMEVVDEKTPEKITGSNAMIQEEHDRIIADRMAGASGGASGKPTGNTNVLGD